MLLVLTGCSATGEHRVRAAPAGSGPLDTLNIAVTAVASDRTALLTDLETIERAATALDQTDQVCLTGHGSAARTSSSQAAPLVSAAAVARARLSSEVATYSAALLSLRAAAPAVSTAPRTALATVVTTGQREATAFTQFRVSVAQVWPSYLTLQQAQGVWITRAVTPWYRTAQEGSNAYSVLVETDRPTLNAARTLLSTAIRAVGGPITTQAASLQAADGALAPVRGTH